MQDWSHISKDMQDIARAFGLPFDKVFVSREEYEETMRMMEDSKWLYFARECMKSLDD